MGKSDMEIEALKGLEQRSRKELAYFRGSDEVSVDSASALADCLEEWLTIFGTEETADQNYLIYATTKDGEHEYTGLALSRTPPSEQAVSAYFSYGDDLTSLKSYSWAYLAPADLEVVRRLNIANYMSEEEAETGDGD